MGTGDRGSPNHWCPEGGQTLPGDVPVLPCTSVCVGGCADWFGCFQATGNSALEAEGEDFCPCPPMSVSPWM